MARPWLNPAPMRLFHRQRPTPVEEFEGIEAEQQGEPRVRAARTLVMSEPELVDLVGSDPRLAIEGVEVELAEKGFGTRVVISALPSTGLTQADLERLLDELAEPHKRPFSPA
jgi:hypothetical protein